MEKKVLNYIKHNNMIRYGDKIVLGVSGGADSICLLIMLNKLSTSMGVGLRVVHVNHHLRGKEADDDQKFVEELCKNLSLPLEVFHIDVKRIAIENNCSEEEAGRIARYDIFQKVATDYGANHIAVAHNVNDNVETMLFNMARGTGIKGAAGIAPTRDNIIRPILCLTRREIEDYLVQCKQAYRTDSTNLKEDYSRNKIRNKILPYMEENINSATVMNMAKVAEELREIEEVLEEETTLIFEKSTRVNDTKGVKNCLVLNKVTEYKELYIRRVIRMALENVSGKLKDITRQHVESVRQLFDNSTGTQVDLPYKMTARKTYEGVLILVKTSQKAEAIDDNSIFPDKERKQLCVEIYKDKQIQNNNIISLETISNWSKNQIEDDLMYTKLVDCGKIKGSLVVRKRMPGDFIRLNGTEKEDNKYITKKIKDFFINEKIPREVRDDILLVADGNEIVWIIGYRLSAAYKVTDKTKKVLIMRLYDGR